jgi:Cupredoxin-like domain
MMAVMLLVAGALTFAAMPALAADAVTEVTLAIEGNRFTPEEIKVPAGKAFVLIVINRDRAAEEFESQDLRIEKIIPAGKTVRLRMPPLKAGSYPFIGDYHATTAKGRIVAE